MSFFAADSTLFAPLFGDEKIGALFSDEQFVRYLLQVEAALARLGLIPPEAATFALAPFMPRSEARALVGEAYRAALAEGRHLIDVVCERTDAPVEWEAVRDEAAYLGSSQQFIDRVLAQAPGN